MYLFIYLECGEALFGLTHGDRVSESIAKAADQLKNQGFYKETKETPFEPSITM